jgi:hypothetical protein
MSLGPREGLLPTEIVDQRLLTSSPTMRECGSFRRLCHWRWELWETEVILCSPSPGAAGKRKPEFTGGMAKRRSSAPREKGVCMAQGNPLNQGPGSGPRGETRVQAGSVPAKHTKDTKALRVALPGNGTGMRVGVGRAPTEFPARGRKEGGTQL